MFLIRLMYLKRKTPGEIDTFEDLSNIGFSEKDDLKNDDYTKKRKGSK